MGFNAIIHISYSMVLSNEVQRALLCFRKCNVSKCASFYKVVELLLNTNPNSTSEYHFLFQCIMATCNLCKEMAEGRNTICATICLESSGSDLVSRIGNAIYDQCRAGRLAIPGFPAFDPLLAALKAGCNVERTGTFKVSCQRGDSLLVLESLAQKWINDPLTADRAAEAIKNHNDEFNKTSDYWLVERTYFLDSQDAHIYPQFPHLCFKDSKSKQLGFCL